VSTEEHPSVPDVDLLAHSMLLVHGAHDDHHSHSRSAAGGSARPEAGPTDPRALAALHEATQHDRERYLNSGLQPVNCRFCHVSVLVKKLGPGQTSVQWSTDAAQHCAYFTEVRKSGGQPERSRACPKLADSIDHAIAEGILEAVSTAPPPGDG